MSATMALLLALVLGVPLLIWAMGLIVAGVASAIDLLIEMMK